MSVTQKSGIVAFLEQHDQETWNKVLDELLPSVHLVDRIATRIWFGFWPIELTEALQDPRGREEMARIMDLEGEWHLEKQMDSSVEFLYGARYWVSVKRAVLAHAERSEPPDEAPIVQQIRDVARKVAIEEGTDEPLVLGITAVAFNILQQVGIDSFSAVVNEPAGGAPYRGSAEGVARRRGRKRGGGRLSFLRGANRIHKVLWSERDGASFKAFHGEDIAAAAAKVEGDFRAMDYRRPEGPIPVECRIGSCGYCWIGVIDGKENLAEPTEYERKRLQYFGYDQASDPKDGRPPIRLACQAQCRGDVTLVIPPWNGELKRRFDKTRDKLGTV